VNIRNAFIASVLAFALAAGNAYAFSIVDSGPGRDSGGSNLDYDYTHQWLAQQFTLDQAYRVTSVEGWIGAWIPGTVMLALYTDTPLGPGNELFASSFNVDTRLNAWHGVSGLAWDLSAGSYWAAFEVRDGQSMRGYIGGEPLYAVGRAAYSRNYGKNWTEIGGSSLPLRIEGILV
jgi:hypothetical protein